jgi:lipopolysaccharide/colanic/teichoic acid biosynthesis glycosyltransferase
MIDLDLEYIERWSLWFDLKILARTPFVVVHGRGAW